MNDDPARALGAMYPSASKTDTPAPSPGVTTPKPAAASSAPATLGTAPQLAKAAWQAPESRSPAAAAQPAKPTQPDAPRDHAAAVYAEPMKTFADVVAATPLPEGDAQAAGFDIGDEGKAAREAVRSALLASGASAAETSELWTIATEAARPDAVMPDHDTARAELIAEWGSNYDTRLASARTFFKGIARKHPAIVEEVRALHLDNNPAFLKALHSAAQRRGR